jgi:hypothetical protein
MEGLGGKPSAAPAAVVAADRPRCSHLPPSAPDSPRPQRGRFRTNRCQCAQARRSRTQPGATPQVDPGASRSASTTLRRGSGRGESGDQPDSSQTRPPQFSEQDGRNHLFPPDLAPCFQRQPAKQQTKQPWITHASGAPRRCKIVGEPAHAGPPHAAAGGSGRGGRAQLAVQLVDR